jgi:prephenate dehydrogenase
VGSTKEEIVAKLEKIFPLYVGSHPLAGSERRGVINAHPDIFKDSLCIVTPTPNSKSAALAKITKLWAGLGVKVVILGPQAHDKILSFISHLPHVAAFSLIGCVSPKYLGLASAGLKDTTRIAASDSGLWSDIFLSNRKNILEAIEVFELNIARIKRAIQRKDRKSLLRILKRAKQKRDSLAS